MKALRVLFNTYVSKRQPISLIHFLTQRCNARCKHCFIDFDDPNTFRNELSTQEIEKLTKTFGKELYSVYLTGGEPFLRKDVTAVVLAYCRNTSVGSVNLATNGMYTDSVRQFIDEFRAARTGKRLMISISIDNFEQQHDENRRVKGLNQRALATFRMLDAYADPLIVAVIAITVAPHNYANVVELYRSLRAGGITRFIPILMREQGVVKSIEKKREVLAAHRALVELIEADQRRGQTHGTGNDLLGSYVNARNTVFNSVIPDIYLGQGRPFHCTAGTLFGVVYPNGDVYPCEVQAGFPLGNLRDYGMNFKKLWRSQRARTTTQAMLDTGCACTFDGAWSINVVARSEFLPGLVWNFSRNVVQTYSRRALARFAPGHADAAPSRHEALVTRRGAASGGKVALKIVE